MRSGMLFQVASADPSHERGDSEPVGSRKR
jgi:hypothetical protein